MSSETPVRAENAAPRKSPSKDAIFILMALRYRLMTISGPMELNRHH